MLNYHFKFNAVTARDHGHFNNRYGMNFISILSKINIHVYSG
jgi:hypothetical protein